MILVLEENWDAPSPTNYDDIPEGESTWYDKLKELIERILFGK